MPQDERSVESSSITRSMEITERVTKVEVRIDSLAADLNRTATIIGQQTNMMHQLAERQGDVEMTAVAIRERTDQHTKTIEHLQSSEVDTGKILAAMKVQLDFVRYIGITVGSLIIGYLFSHFFR